MKLSTATTFDESKYETIGIVMGMQTRSVSLFREFFSSIGTIFGGKSNLINAKLLKAREDAVKELEKNAEAMGADMVIGIDIDMGTMALGAFDGGSGAPIFTFVATGTALRSKDAKSTETTGGNRRKTLRRKLKK